MRLNSINVSYQNGILTCRPLSRIVDRCHDLRRCISFNVVVDILLRSQDILHSEKSLSVDAAIAGIDSTSTAILHNAGYRDF